MENNVISVTEIGIYKRCHRLWDYKYRKNLVPLREAPHFFVGKLVHRTLATITEEPNMTVAESWADALQTEISAYEKRYIDAIGVLPSKVEYDEKLDRAYMPLKMIENYAQKWGSPLPDGFQLFQTEQTCIVSIPETNMFLEGTLDGLVIDTVTKSLYILERKTYEQRPSIESLEHNEQFTLYAWIVSRLFPDLKLGGILYDGCWKRETPPRGKTLDDLFLRHLILKSEEELHDAEQMIIAVAKEIEAGPSIYPNRVWQGCWDDRDFHRLCSAETKGEDVEEIIQFEYQVKENVRWFEDDDS